MSKIVKVNQGDYRLVTQPGGNITLDTGVHIGNVIITGNLNVQGTTTTISSSEVNLSDNILYLNVPANHNDGFDGIPGTLNYVSGIEIDRGTRSHAQLFFKETVYHYDPVTATEKAGSFVMKTKDNVLSGLQVGSILNDGSTDLVFDLQGSAHALLVANSPAYETHVTQDNHLITKKYLNQYVAASGFPNGVATVDRIFFPTTGNIGQSYSSIEAFGNRIEFGVAQTIIASVSAAGLTVGNVNTYQDTISNQSGTNNLVLTAANYGVEVNGILNLDNQSSGNVSTYGAPVSNKTKLYSSATIGPGKTGLYIANTTTSDELVSKNRAVLLSILL